MSPFEIEHSGAPRREAPIDREDRFIFPIPSRRRNGLTLIEMLIALSILAGGLLSMATIQVQTMKSSQRGRHLSQATSLVESQLEQLQRERWTNIPAVGWTAPQTITNQVERDNDLEGEQAYQVSWRITTLTIDKTRSIDVRVSWVEADGLTRNVAISSIRNNFEAL